MDTIQRLKQYKKHAVLERAQSRFKLNTKTIRTRLAQLEVKNVPLSDKTKLLSMDYDFWSQHVPVDCKDLQAWLEYQKLQKILTTYLFVYSSVDRVYPRWHVLGARSGRMSASSPPIQNIPKTRYGLRGLFIPDKGHIFIRADYVAQEMYTLCEVMLEMGIDGPLHSILKSGDDIHTVAASIVLQKPQKEVTKDERQGQKVLDFGVPGGLGPVRLSEYAHKIYGLSWNVNESAARRASFFRAFPDILQYLRRLQVSEVGTLRKIVDERMFYDIMEELEHSNHSNIRDYLHGSQSEEYQVLGQRLERQMCVVLPTGRVRKGCTFTEAANTNFQGLASDVIKQAAWRCFLASLDIRLLVHDEIVISSTQENYRCDSTNLEQSMVGAFRTICPRVGPFAKVEVSGPLDRWGLLTDKEGKEICV